MLPKVGDYVCVRNDKKQTPNFVRGKVLLGIVNRMLEALMQNRLKWIRVQIRKYSVSLRIFSDEGERLSDGEKIKFNHNQYRWPG